MTVPQQNDWLLRKGKASVAGPVLPGGDLTPSVVFTQINEGEDEMEW